MGVRFDRLRYEVFQNLILSPMNTASVRPAVATTPTACGIETIKCLYINLPLHRLQQHLPPAVLKHFLASDAEAMALQVATTPTACGIETISQYHNMTAFIIERCNNTYRLRYAPKGARQQRSKATMKSARLKYLSEARVKQR